MMGRVLFGRSVPSMIARSRNAGISSKSAVAGLKQELPPAVGYKAFEWERIPSAKPLIGPIQIFLFGCITIYGYITLQWERRRWRGEHLEKLDAKIALMPLLFAERDRVFLKRIRRNFEEECRLMKDMPGWEVGKWFDQPVYKTVPQGMWIDPHLTEFWAHAHPQLCEQYFHWWWTA